MDNVWRRRRRGVGGMKEGGRRELVEMRGFRKELEEFTERWKIVESGCIMRESLRGGGTWKL